MRLGVAIFVRPRLWLPALRALWRVRGRGGLAPGREWWEWRLVTAYGDRRNPKVGDVIAWLRFCDAFEKAR